MCEAIRGMIKQGVEEGIMQGIEQGIEQGVSQFASLTEILLRDSRTDDLLKAANDKQFREQLFREYGIHKLDKTQ